MLIDPAPANNMALCQVVASLSRRAGGLLESVSGLADALNRSRHVESTVVGLEDEFTALDRAAWHGAHTLPLKRTGPRLFGYSAGLVTAISRCRPDLIVNHGIWMYPSIAVRAAARQLNIPYVVSPHGMLDEWAMAHSRLKKRVAWQMYERAHLKGAACIRALNKQEAASIAGLDLKVPICIVPNGIALPTHLDPPAPKWRRLIAPKKKVLLFIGRLHPKKGLSELIRAWHGLPSQRIGDWHLAIAGWDDGGHEDSLHALANRGPNSTSISFIGSVFGAEKDATLRHSNAFILPSKSEGLPMAVLEAWSYKLPVLMSRQCNLVEAFDNQCAIECGNTDSVIAQALLKLIALSTDEVDRLKDRAYGFVAERYTWVNISKQFESVCRWLVHHEAQPGCVVR